MMWSKHSRRIDPISRSAMPFCPRWLGQIYDLDLIEHQTTLLRVLEADTRQKRVPIMAPEPPPDFVQRSREFDALKARLLDAKADAVAAITAALKGAGGYGDDARQGPGL